MWTFREVGIVRLYHFVSGEALSRYVTLVEVVELADPSSHRNHVDAYERKDAPFHPREQKLLFPIFNYSTFTESPEVDRREKELEDR